MEENRLNGCFEGAKPTAAAGAELVPLGPPTLDDVAVVELSGLVLPTCTALAEIETRLAQIEEIFSNHKKPILDFADLAREYVDHAQTISRQDVAKTRGRPEGGIARAVRQLPLPGKTDAARKKRLERLLQIANIGPRVRAAAQKASVAHFQSDLLEIAKAETEEDQLQKVSDIVARNHERALARKNRTAGEKCLRAVIEYPAERKRELAEALTQFGEDHEVRPQLRTSRHTVFTQSKTKCDVGNSAWPNSE